MLLASQVLNKILQTKNYDIITVNGFDVKNFRGYESEFEFIDTHIKQYGNVPDIETFVEKFPQFELFRVEESDKYLADRLFEEEGYNNFAQILPKLADYVQKDSRDAYEFLMANMNKLKPQGIISGVNISSDSLARYEHYLNRSLDENNNTNVITSGLPELDEFIHGWEFGEELVTIVGRVNQGKSWMLMKFLAAAWQQGYRVGMYSGEMNHLKLGYRLDALLGHFSNKCLTWGGQVDVDSYKEFLQDMASKPNPFIISTQLDFGGKPTVQKLRRLIETYQLDILGVDQFSLVEDGRAKFNDPLRLRMAHIAEDLFLLSTEYKIPIIGLAQANRAGADAEDGLGLENIKESDDIAANSSKVLGIRQTSNGLALDIIKNREGKVGVKLLYKWDIDFGTFEFIPSSDSLSAPVQSNKSNNSKPVKTKAVNLGAF